MGTNSETVLLFSACLEHFAVLVASSRKQTIIDIEQEEVKKEDHPFLLSLELALAPHHFSLSSVNF
jgi:hypothetical protein